MSIKDSIIELYNELDLDTLAEILIILIIGISVIFVLFGPKVENSTLTDFKKELIRQEIQITNIEFGEESHDEPFMTYDSQLKIMVSRQRTVHEYYYSYGTGFKNEKFILFFCDDSVTLNCEIR